MSLLHASIAANRFGLGARPGQLAKIQSDPRGWLIDQLKPDRAAVPVELAALPPSSAVVRYNRDQRMMLDGDANKRRAYQDEVRKSFRSEMSLRELAAARTEVPFRERLVRFWCNHFAVSTTANAVRALAGAYEREAIRPHLDGSFADLLLAAERHAAMQVYLDNVRSVGPDSEMGERSGRGLNENHAREILELHTLGVDGGYTQADVEGLSAILTGWGLVYGRGEVTGSFVFDPRRHQPGSKKLLGQTYRETGESEGVMALRALAVHPSTARFVATKLVRHFASDHPPAEAIDAIADVFTQTGGDLPSVHRALVGLPAAWERRLSKLKTPAELVLSTARSLGYKADGDPMLRSVIYLGQMPFSAPSPQGWPDAAGEWLGPEAVLTRVEWAEKVGEDGGGRIEDAVARADDVLGPLLTERTRQAIAEASGPGQAVALLVASPEFQRR